MIAKKDKEEWRRRRIAVVEIPKSGQMRTPGNYFGGVGLARRKGPKWG
jgi:hypothetical protein